MTCCARQIGSFFMINLCLVVIATQFSETKKRETERMWAERQRCSSSATLASTEQLGNCYDEIIRYVAHLGRVARRRLLAIWRRCVGRRRRRLRRRRRRRRRRQKTEEGANNSETAVTGVAGAHNGDGDNGTSSPRRLLRFDDQPTSATTRCHRDATRMNGFRTSTPPADLTATNVAPSINGQLTSDIVDGNERNCFCSSTNSTADGGVRRFYTFIFVARVFSV